MKISIEKKMFLPFKTDVYILSIGTHKYHYEKLADILFRVAVIFEPPQEEEKPKKKYVKRSEKFPLGDAILKSLSKVKDVPQSMEAIIHITKTPREYTRSIWGAVVGKLVKRGLLTMAKIKTINGSVKQYRIAK
jgi:hypothetical protein